MSLFEPISSDEFKAATQPKAKTSTGVRRGRRKEPDTEDRTLTGWYKLDHFMDFCTVPMHDELQRSMNEEKQAYRQRYPVRMVITIGDYQVCRDCYVAEADK